MHAVVDAGNVSQHPVTDTDEFKVRDEFRSLVVGRFDAAVEQCVPEDPGSGDGGFRVHGFDAEAVSEDFMVEIRTGHDGDMESGGGLDGGSTEDEFSVELAGKDSIQWLARGRVCAHAEVVGEGRFADEPAVANCDAVLTESACELLQDILVRAELIGGPRRVGEDSEDDAGGLTVCGDMLDNLVDEVCGVCARFREVYPKRGADPPVV